MKKMMMNWRSTMLLLLSLMIGLGGCASTLVKALPQHDLATYENQVPSLTATAKQHISSSGGARKSISNKLLVTPIVHSFYFDYKLGPNEGMNFQPYWLTRGASPHLIPEMHDNALQYVVDWTEVYTFDGLEKRGFSVIKPKTAIENNDSLATAGTTPIGTKVWRNFRRAENGTLLAGVGQAFGAKKRKDWAGLTFSSFRSNTNVEAVMYVHSSAKWEYKGHARIDDGAIVIFDVHHWLEVMVCTSDNKADCKTARIPKSENDDVVSTLFIPALRGMNEKKLNERSTIAIKLAAQHSAELILTALDDIIVKQ